MIYWWRRIPGNVLVIFKKHVTFPSSAIIKQLCCKIYFHSIFFFVVSFPPLTSLFLSAEYVIQFEDQDMKEKGWVELRTVGGNQEREDLSLWPYMSFRFRVIAINDVGKSDPSKPSDIFTTPPEGKRLVILMCSLPWV